MSSFLLKRFFFFISFLMKILFIEKTTAQKCSNNNNNKYKQVIPLYVLRRINETLLHQTELKSRLFASSVIQVFDTCKWHCFLKMVRLCIYVVCVCICVLDVVSLTAICVFFFLLLLLTSSLCLCALKFTFVLFSTSFIHNSEVAYLSFHLKQRTQLHTHTHTHIQAIGYLFSTYTNHSILFACCAFSF